MSSQIFLPFNTSTVTRTAEKPVNDFQECLARSHAASDLPFWPECYRKAFPTMIAMHDHRQDGAHQRQGIDRSIVLSNGTTIWVDEKVRGTNRITGKIYRDIALEEWSVEERKVPGWAVKSLFANYVAYAIAPLGICYMLPVLQLQQAWANNSAEWKRKYFQVRARNSNYTTVSWAIPVPELFKAIGDCLRINFSPFSMEE